MIDPKPEIATVETRLESIALAQQHAAEAKRCAELEAQIAALKAANAAQDAQLAALKAEIAIEFAYLAHRLVEIPETDHGAAFLRVVFLADGLQAFFAALSRMPRHITRRKVRA